MSREVIRCGDCGQRFTAGAYVRHTRYGRCLSPEKLAERKALVLDRGVWKRAGVFPLVSRKRVARQTSRTRRLHAPWATREARRASKERRQDESLFPEDAA